MSTKKFKTIRLVNTYGYKRPEVTITDSLQNEDSYREKLKGYQEVKDIDSVVLGTHVRYFVYNSAEKTWKFRTGGLLTKKDHPKYVVLSNGKYSWSVQKEIPDENSENFYETKFFKIMTKHEVAQSKLSQQEIKIQELQQDNKKLADQLNKLISKIKNGELIINN